MIVLTEADLRVRYRADDCREIHVTEGTFVTPTAREYIKEKGLSLIFDSGDNFQVKESKSVSADGNKPYSEKPEHLTHLRGNILIPKNHPRIICRGKLDSLQAKILEVQVMAQTDLLMVRDLQELLAMVRKILSCEVKDEPLEAITLLGLDDVQLREVSHHPKKYFGIEHILPSHTMGEMVVALNSLRTAVRETEISAMNAFYAEGELVREDIIKALNRLSSAVYVIICRKLAGWYEKER